VFTYRKAKIAEYGLCDGYTAAGSGNRFEQSALQPTGELPFPMGPGDLVFGDEAESMFSIIDP